MAGSRERIKVRAAGRDLCVDGRGPLYVRVRERWVGAVLGAVPCDVVLVGSLARYCLGRLEGCSVTSGLMGESTLGGNVGATCLLVLHV